MWHQNQASFLFWWPRSSTVCEESSTITIPFSRNLKNCMLYCLVFMPEAPIWRFTMFGCQPENNAEDFKRLGKSNGDYKCMASQKPQSKCSDKKKKKKKRTPKFIGEIQAIIDNDPSKSIRYIARDMRVSKFLIRQVVHKDIWYFSHTEKG